MYFILLAPFENTRSMRFGREMPTERPPVPFPLVYRYRSRPRPSPAPRGLCRQRRTVGFDRVRQVRFSIRSFREHATRFRFGRQSVRTGRYSRPIRRVRVARTRYGTGGSAATGASGRFRFGSKLPPVKYIIHVPRILRYLRVRPDARCTLLAASRVKRV